MHTLVGAGKSDGAMDASNLLKPALAASFIVLVRPLLMSIANASRRTPLLHVQPIFVNEPTVEDTISILRGLKEKYELVMASV